MNGLRQGQLSLGLHCKSMSLEEGNSTLNCTANGDGEMRAIIADLVRVALTQK